MTDTKNTEMPDEFASMQRFRSENPDNNDALAAYADWLKEQDPSEEQPALHRDRAEFIHAQLLLSQPVCENRAASERRAAELWAKHGKLWTKPFAAMGMADVVFERGFAQHAAISAEDILKHADALFECEPLPTLNIKSIESPEQLQRILALPVIGRMHTLDLSGNSLGAANMQALAECPNLDKVRTLKLSRCTINFDGLRQVLGSHHLANLKELDLSETQLSAENMLALANCPGLGKLHALKLSRCGITPEGMYNLLSSEHIVLLEELDVSHNALNAGNVSRLATAAWCCPELKKLNLAGNPLGIEGIRALASSGYLKLEELDLANTTEGKYPMSGGVIFSMMWADFAETLVSLNLSGVPLPLVDKVCIHNPYKDKNKKIFPNLQWLDLSNTRIAQADYDLLKESELFRRLETLHLEGNDLSPATRTHIAEASGRSDPGRHY